MAKKEADHSQLDPYKEIVIVHDTSNGAINAVGSINEKTFKHSEVPAISANSKQFMEVKKTSVVKNFIQNLANQYKEPSRFAFYIVPEAKMPDLVDKLYAINENPKDTDLHKSVRQYRTSGRQLDRVKFDKSEIPFEMIGAMTGKPRSEIEKNILPVMEGKPFPELITLNYKLQDGVMLSGGQSFRMQRDDNGVASANFFSPKPRPEFEEQRWAQEFTPEEKNRMASQKPLDRLIGFENPKTGQREYCFVKFDPMTNLLEPVHPRDVQMEEWAFRSKLDATKMSELALGHKIHIENGKIGPEAAEFSGNIQYDPYQERFVASDMKFQKPYIPQNVRDQLKDKPDQLAKLESYEPIDGRQIKGRSGENYTSDIRVSRQTNTLEWGSFLGQSQSQTHGRGKEQDKTQTNRPEQGQWPENDAYQSQNKGQGQKM